MICYHVPALSARKAGVLQERQIIRPTERPQDPLTLVPVIVIIQPSEEGRYGDPYTLHTAIHTASPI